MHIRNPDVSVVIPVYNRESTIKKALRSVLNQTFEDFEVIVVDDGSIDNTQQVVSSIYDPRIKYIRNEKNRGAPVARNRGIKYSRGKYVALLDSDDWWLPEKIEKQVKILDNESKKTGVVYTDLIYKNEDKSKYKILKKGIKKHNIYHELLKRNIVGSCSSVMIRKLCFEDVGYFDINLPSFQDMDMWIRLAKVYDFYYLDEPLVVICKHKKNRITKSASTRERGIEIFFGKYKEEMGETNYRKQKAFQMSKVGYLYYLNDERLKAREKIIESMEYMPFSCRNFIYYIITFIKPELYKKIKNLLRE